MKRGITILFLLCAVYVFGATTHLQKRDIDLDLGWKFATGDHFYGGEYIDFNDADWRTLDLPHDWSIEDLPDDAPGKIHGPFSKESGGKGSTGHVVGGIAWYRKTFKLDAKDQIVYLNFDGVFMESEVWINGRRVGYHPNGYTPFYYDITKFLNKDGKNFVSVRVQNIGDNSRWYSGSGIYRHVWLTVVPQTHIDVWGTYVTTPKISKKEATIHIETSIKNDFENCELLTSILDKTGKVVTKITSKVNSKTVSQELIVKKPKLWDMDSPTLYSAKSELLKDGQVIDKYETSFGIRSIEFSAEKGFLLNGKSVLLKGGCIHHDNGLLGSATYDRAEERKIQTLKANGFNAIRTSHNPPSIQFLNACDREGVLVMDELFDTWECAKKVNGVHRFFNEWWERDVNNFVKRDRNHPSVIMWSIGNEIRERATERGVEIAQNLVNAFKALDDTRPVTNAICIFWDIRGLEWKDTISAFAVLDVGGYNYQYERYEDDHEKHPDRIMVGTESIPMESYENWQKVEKYPYVIGDFVWTGMDYIGESALANALYLSPDSNTSHSQGWPWYNAWCGDIDIIGNKKMQSYYRDIFWNDSPLEIAVHSPVPKGKVERISWWGWPQESKSWNWEGHEGESLEVKVFSKGDKVKLELNGKTIGEQTINTDTTITASFKVKYQPGELKAAAFKDGKIISTQTLSTTGKPYKIQLDVDRSKIKADRDDLAFINVSILDKNGQLVPNAKAPISLEITGAGELIGAGSASPTENKSFQQPSFTTFEGKALAIIRPYTTAGEIVVKARSQNLKETTVTIATK